jgi:hypothetical protein
MNRINSCGLALAAALIVIAPATVLAAIPGFTISAERAGIADISMEGVHLEYTSLAGLGLSIGRINLPGNGNAIGAEVTGERVIGPLTLDCPGELAAILDGLCAQGQVTL